jgi:hypothetical protein
VSGSLLSSNGLEVNELAEYEWASDCIANLFSCRHVEETREPVFKSKEGVRILTMYPFCRCPILPVLDLV